ncbi:hypothetical protein PP758_gp40 [Pseudomonas phage PAP02]|nr:hypothetical protein PP758_gp40 [Pseudomonas phage PAP02]QKE55111.1 hypothetical protein PAP02_040 [Pseudomonas phage PAP02]
MQRVHPPPRNGVQTRALHPLHPTRRNFAMGDLSKACMLKNMHVTRVLHLIEMRNKLTNTLRDNATDDGMATLEMFDAALKQETDRFLRAFRAVGNENINEIKKAAE